MTENLAQTDKEVRPNPRLPDWLWREAKAKAALAGITGERLVVLAIAAYVGVEPPPVAKEEADDAA